MAQQFNTKSNGLTIYIIMWGSFYRILMDLVKHYLIFMAKRALVYRFYNLHVQEQVNQFQNIIKTKFNPWLEYNF